MKVVKISLLAEEKKKKKMKITDRIKNRKDYSSFRDGFILTLIVFTSVSVFEDISFISLPIFLTVVFILLQIKRLVTKKVENKK